MRWWHRRLVLGMVLDGDDRPFASFLWPGNAADVTRLMPVVRLSLAAKSRFPETETAEGRDWFQCGAYCEGRPSIWC